MFQARIRPAHWIFTHLISFIVACKEDSRTHLHPNMYIYLYQLTLASETHTHSPILKYLLFFRISMISESGTEIKP